MLDLDAIFDADMPLPIWSMVRPDDLPGDWHFLWDERAAVMEYDGGLPRERAEALALAEIVKEMRAAAGGDTCVGPK